MIFLINFLFLIEME